MSQKTLLDPLPRQLTELPEERWPVYRGSNKPIRVLVSKRFMVQVFAERGGYCRLSVNRVKRKAGGKWKDGITWDELQQIKKECGFGEWLALEVFPEDSRLIKDANMRHLWLPPVRPEFAW